MPFYHYGHLETWIDGYAPCSTAIRTVCKHAGMRFFLALHACLKVHTLWHALTLHALACRRR